MEASRTKTRSSFYGLPLKKKFGKHLSSVYLQIKVRMKGNFFSNDRIFAFLTVSLKIFEFEFEEKCFAETESFASKTNPIWRSKVDSAPAVESSKARAKQKFNRKNKISECDSWIPIPICFFRIIHSPRWRYERIMCLVRLGLIYKWLHAILDNFGPFPPSSHLLLLRP